MYFWLGIKTEYNRVFADCFPGVFYLLVGWFFFTLAWVFEALLACRFQGSETSHSNSASPGCMPILNPLQHSLTLCPSGFYFCFEGQEVLEVFKPGKAECLHYLLVISIISHGTKGKCSVSQGIQTLTSGVLFSILKDFVTLPKLKSHCRRNRSLTLACERFFLSRNSLDCSQLYFLLK